MKVPLFLVQGSKDPIIVPSANEKFMAEVVKQNPKSKFYSAVGSMHETFNDKQRDEIFKEIQNWLETVIKLKE